MVQSFLNYLLPKDVYKRTRILYFMAEIAFFIVAILLIFSLVKLGFI